MSSGGASSEAVAEALSEGSGAEINPNTLQSGDSSSVAKAVSNAVNGQAISVAQSNSKAVIAVVVVVYGSIHTPL